MREGSWTRQAVAAEGQSLSGDDSKMMEALAFGTIRHLGSIDRSLAAKANRPLSQLDPIVIDQLRVALFELWYGRARAAAVVDSAVEAMRVQRSQAGGFVNAVLRKFDSGSPPDDRASRLALPEWLLGVLDEGWGSTATDSFALASLDPAPMAVRARPGRAIPEGEAVAGIPGAFLVRPGTPSRDYPLADPSSVAVVACLGVEPGMRVADLAAAPGGKTMDIADRLAGTGNLIAIDRHQRRALKAARRVRDAHWVIADGAHPPLPKSSFDRVLVDAPCTGLGTIRRRPELRYKVSPEEISRLAKLQRGLIEAGLELLTNGGRLIYSVCTVTAAETIDQVADFKPLPVPPFPDLPGEKFGEGWLLAPHLTGTDGMFIAVIGRD